MKLKHRSLFMPVFIAISISGCHFCDTKDLLHPNGVAVSPDGEIFVMDRGHNRVVVLNDSLQYSRSFGHAGRGSSGIFRGWDMSLDQKQNILFGNISWVDEFEQQIYECIKIYNNSGVFIKDIGVIVANSLEDTDSPYGVHASQKGHIFAVSFFKNAVRVFNNEGNIIGLIDVDKKISGKSPSGVADVTTNSDDSYLYVTDTYLAEIRKYELNWFESNKVTAKLVTTIGGIGKSPFFNYPHYLSLSENGKSIFVSDLGNQRVIEILESGEVIREFKLNKTWQPFGIALDRKGRVLVADAFGNQIVRFSNTGIVETK